MGSFDHCIIADPDVLLHLHTAPAMEKRTQSQRPGHFTCDLLKEPILDSNKPVLSNVAHGKPPRGNGPKHRIIYCQMEFSAFAVPRSGFSRLLLGRATSTTGRRVSLSCAHCTLSK